MANLLDLKNKISSTKNTGQITKALELVSASRQKRSLDFLQNSRFLRNGVNDLMSTLSNEVENLEKSTDESSIPKFFKTNKSNKVLVVVLMSRRGLCGPINSSLFFNLVRFKKEINKEVEFITINRIAQKYLKNFNESVISFFNNIPENPEMDDVYPLIDYIKTNYFKYENIYLAYSDFVKTGIIEPRIELLLPINRSSEVLPTSATAYTIEPDPATVLDTLSSLYIDLEIYEALLSSQTAEHSARMIAMKKASDNVKTVVENLTLTYNKERQARITQAMAEISANI